MARVLASSDRCDTENLLNDIQSTTSRFTRGKIRPNLRMRHGRQDAKDWHRPYNTLDNESQAAGGSCVRVFTCARRRLSHIPRTMGPGDDTWKGEPSRSGSRHRHTINNQPETGFISTLARSVVKNTDVCFVWANHFVRWVRGVYDYSPVTPPDKRESTFIADGHSKLYGWFLPGDCGASRRQVLRSNQSAPDHPTFWHFDLRVFTVAKLQAPG